MKRRMRVIGVADYIGSIPAAERKAFREKLRAQRRELERWQAAHPIDTARPVR